MYSLIPKQFSCLNAPFSLFNYLHQKKKERKKKEKSWLLTCYKISVLVIKYMVRNKDVLQKETSIKFSKIGQDVARALGSWKRRVDSKYGFSSAFYFSLIKVQFLK